MLTSQAPGNRQPQPAAASGCPARIERIEHVLALVSTRARAAVLDPNLGDLGIDAAHVAQLQPNTHPALARSRGLDAVANHAADDCLQLAVVAFNTNRGIAR